MSRHLVTGAAGFIGSHLAEKLIRDGHAVVGIDNLSTGKLYNIESFREAMQFIVADVRNWTMMQEMMRGVEIVYHQAALGSVPRSIDDPLETHRNNVEGTLSVLEAARSSGVRRVVIASSSSIYGDVGHMKSEYMRCNPLSPYAASKVACEAYARAYSKAYGIETVCLRYFNVYGPRQDPDSQYAAVVPRFFTNASLGRPLIIYGDGGQSRDFTFVTDVVEANLRAASCDLHQDVYNVGGGREVSINELARTVAEIFGRELEVKHEDLRPGDVRSSAADLTKIFEDFAFWPQVRIEEGLKKTKEEGPWDIS